MQRNWEVTQEQAAVVEFRGGVATVMATAGSGKCLGRGTPVLRYDGRVVPVETIQEGDRLMGPDSRPRLVTQTRVGYGALYRIQPVKGDPWVCNDVHVMTLAGSNAHIGEVIDVPLNEILTTCKRPDVSWKLMRAGQIEWPERPLPVDPRLLGLWLGDGSRNRPDITNNDPEVYEDCVKGAAALGLETVIGIDKRNGNRRISFRSHARGGGGRPRSGTNPLIPFFQECSTPEKHIPDQYLINSAANRLELLAGIVDADGYTLRGGIEVVSHLEGLARQILFLARSLGLAAYVHTKRVRLPGWAEPRTYWRITISGDTDRIPTHVPRRKAQPRRQIKRHLVTGWTAESIGEGEYFGFTLDEDGRFLLGDFTVTHNTRTVIYTILDHLAEGIPGERILAVAYNRAAANEMKDRILRWAPEDLRLEATTVQVSTFHAFCRSTLVQNGGRAEVLEDRDARRWIGDILRTEMQDFDTDPADILGSICYFREVLPGSDPATWIRAGASQQVMAVAARYMDRLHREEVIDFTEMQAAVLRLLDRRPHVRAALNAHFDLMCLDEAQDQNPIRCAIWARLTGDAYQSRQCRTVFLVGDWAQSIYRFTGATPEVFLAYQAQAKAAGCDFNLSRNFRSHPEVVAAGNRVLGQDVGVPARAAESSGPVISILDYDHGAEEATDTATRIQGWIAGGTAPRDIAVIYRTRGAGAQAQLALAKLGVPYVVRGGSGFFSAACVADALAYLEAGTTWDVEALERASKTPSRFLGAAFREALRGLADGGTTGPALLNPAMHSPRALRGVRLLQNQMGEVSAACDGTPIDALDTIYRLQGSKGDTFATAGPKERLEDRKEMLTALMDVALGFDSVPAFLQMVHAATSAEHTDNGEVPDAVVLTTAHRSKGLEWPTVCLIGLSEGVWPHRYALAEGGEDEERRLAFVGVTRAKDRLVASSRGEYFGRPVDPSRYLNALRDGSRMAPCSWPALPEWTRWLQAGCPLDSTPLPPHISSREV